MRNFIKGQNKVLYIVVSTLLLLIVIGGVIFASFFAYSRFVLEPQKEIANIQLDLTKSTSNKKKELQECLYKAETKRTKRWQGQCVALGKKTDSDGSCLIPKDAAEHYDSEYQKDREFCLKLHK